MLPFFSKHHTAISAVKRSIKVTGILTNALTPGKPAMYLYNGNLIRTSCVEIILEAAPDYVQFETSDLIYTLCFSKQPNAASRLTA